MVTPPAEKQRRCPHTPLARGAGQSGAAWAASLRVRIWPEYPERYLSEIIWLANQTVGYLPREKPALT